VGKRGGEEGDEGEKGARKRKIGKRIYNEVGT